MLGLRRQLKIIWNLIQENSEDNYEFSSAEKRALDTQTFASIVLLAMVRKSKRLHFLTDLEWQCNLSLVYYNSLAA